MLDKRRVIVWQRFIDLQETAKQPGWRVVATSIPLALTLACAWHLSRRYCGGADSKWRAALGWAVLQVLRAYVTLTWLISGRRKRL